MIYYIRDDKPITFVSTFSPFGSGIEFNAFNFNVNYSSSNKGLNVGVGVSFDDGSSYDLTIGADISRFSIYVQGGKGIKTSNETTVYHHSRIGTNMLLYLFKYVPVKIFDFGPVTIFGY